MPAGRGGPCGGNVLRVRRVCHMYEGVARGVGDRSAMRAGRRVCVCASAGGLCEQRDAGEEPGHAPKTCDVKPSMSPLVYNR